MSRWWMRAAPSSSRGWLPGPSPRHAAMHLRAALAVCHACTAQTTDRTHEKYTHRWQCGHMLACAWSKGQSLAKASMHKRPQVVLPTLAGAWRYPESSKRYCGRWRFAQVRKLLYAYAATAPPVATVAATHSACTHAGCLRLSADARKECAHSRSLLAMGGQVLAGHAGQCMAATHDPDTIPDGLASSGAGRAAYEQASNSTCSKGAQVQALGRTLSCLIHGLQPSTADAALLLGLGGRHA